ncbi:protein EFR3 homolog B-like [Chamaea fasciata]|uniref:protein EFR3 homolog B-like n=1 Tax=Chamaea fasciata TaxID=190680 RepID=UPI00336A076D
MALLGTLLGVPGLLQHVQEVIQARQKEAPFLLPEEAFGDNPRAVSVPEPLAAELLFSQGRISDALGGSGYSAERLSSPYTPQSGDEERLSKRKSIGETISLQVEVESRNSPEREQRAPAEEITYETLKKAIVDSVAVEEQERERRRQVVQKFQKAPFEEIAAHCGARASLLQSKLNQIFEITIRPPPSPSGAVPGPQPPHSQVSPDAPTPQNSQIAQTSVPVYEMKFPDLCVY